MIKWFKEKKKDNKGFTLVELVIVVAILAILVGILAPQYTKYVEKSRKAADASNLENLVTAFKTAASDGDDNVDAGNYTITISLADTTLKRDNTILSKNDKIYGLLTSYAGENWANTKLKSKKWVKSDTNKTAKQSLVAEIKVENNGSVTVKYSPANLKDQTNQ